MALLLYSLLSSAKLRPVKGRFVVALCLVGAQTNCYSSSDAESSRKTRRISALNLQITVIPAVLLHAEPPECVAEAEVNRLSGLALNALGRTLPDPRRCWPLSVRRQQAFCNRARTADLAIISMPKSGRTWLRAMLSRLYQEQMGMPDGELLIFDNFHAWSPELPRILFSHIGELFESGEGPEILRGKPVFHLVRWPIDTAISRYFQAKGRTNAFKLGLNGLPADVGRVPIFDFVTSPRHGVPYIVRRLNELAEYLESHPAALTIKYEEARKSPADALLRVIIHSGRSATPESVERAVDYASFSNLQQMEQAGVFKNDRLRARNSSNPDTYKVRRGKIGGYRDYLSAHQCAELESFIQANLTPSYGYASPPSYS
ncbi:MAG TPA: sulfotransferase domain-containing protein [Aestuariivirgaceae bacterium]|nr:sulfotransferase domain-containing protein [Aestuariivirgaceae bacterium]